MMHSSRSIHITNITPHKKALVWLLSAAMLLTLIQVAQAARPTDDALGRYIFSDLAEEVMPSVVTVYVKRDMSKEMSEEELERFRQLRPFFDLQPRGFGTPDAPEEDHFIQESAGSGVIVSEDGYILTNRHVVGKKEFESSVRIVLYDDTEIEAEDVEVIWSHDLIDLAILKINRPDMEFKPIKWGKSEDLRIGERIAAIGSPLDLRLTITQGIVCAKQRDIMAGGDWGGHIQTDAVINPGSSGGPLVNLEGELVGINRIITTNDGRWQGYGFAIPADDARFFADQAIKNGKVELGYIGVSMVGVEENPTVARGLRLPKSQKGVIVTFVHDGTPAQQAGLKDNDVIVGADDAKIETPTSLLHYVARQKIGSKVNLKVLRGNDRDQLEEKTFELKIARRDSEADLRRRILGSLPGTDDTPPVEEKIKEPEYDWMGLTLDETNSGLVIKEIKDGSPAAQAGLRPGDVLLELNRKELVTERDYRSALKRRDQDEVHLLRIERDGEPQTAFIEP